MCGLCGIVAADRGQAVDAGMLRPNQLGGDGGDEMFVGYAVVRGVELARPVHSSHPTVRRFLASPWCRDTLD
jgi:hypothetical protein